jgi:hypothetical protein
MEYFRLEPFGFPADDHRWAALTHMVGAAAGVKHQDGTPLDPDEFRLRPHDGPDAEPDVKTSIAKVRALLGG